MYDMLVTTEEANAKRKHDRFAEYWTYVADTVLVITIQPQTALKYITMISTMMVALLPWS